MENDRRKGLISGSLQHEKVKENEEEPAKKTERGYLEWLGENPSYGA